LKKICLILLLLLLISNSAAAFELKIEQNEFVESADIYLGEIAEFNEAELNSEQLIELRNLKLAKSPQPGYQKFLNKVLVELSIKNLGYDTADFRLKMPKQITIERKAAYIDISKVRAFVEEKLTEAFKLDSEKLVIEELNNPKSYQIAAGNGEYELQFASHSHFNFGNNNLIIEVVKDSVVQNRLYYRFKLGIKKQVFRSLKDLHYNSTLNRNDFEIVEKVIYQNPDQLVSSWENMQKKELKTTLKKGDYLSYQLIKNPYLVQWGDRLKVTIVKNNVVLSSYVTARERGKLGDEITVENENSGYRFQVEVISENEVKYLSP